MKLILDTHVLLWCLKGDKRLSGQCKKLIQETTDDILVSVASIWELSIKITLGKTVIAIEELEWAIVESGFKILPIDIKHAIQYSRLSMHHRDPFDRMLVAQSITEAAYLLTHDSYLKPYGASVLVV